MDERDIRRRTTRQKRAILEYLRAVDSHPSASVVYEEVRKRIPKISLGTIYRTLAVLRQDGLIQELPYEDYSRYDGRIDSHPHMLCLCCGRVCDAGGSPDYVHLISSAQVPGFRVAGYRLDFYGYCSQCPDKTP